MSLIDRIPQDVKGLVFDFDGTVCDTMPAHYIAWRDAVRPYGIDFTTELFEELAGIPVYGTIEVLNERFGTDMHPQKVGDAKEAEFEKVMLQVRPIEPVVELINHAHGKIPMAVGTGGWLRITKAILEHHNLMQYFEGIVTSEMVTKHKPHPETFLECAKILKQKPEDCLVLEDGILGIQAAEACGMRWIDVREFYEVTIGK